MHREQARRVLKPGQDAVFDFEQRRNERRLPIVAVENIDAQAQLADRLHHRAAKEDKPFAVVRVVRAVLLIDPGAIKVVGLIDEVNRNFGADRISERRIGNRQMAEQNPRAHELARQRNLQRDPRRFDGESGIGDGRIMGQKERGLDPQAGQFQRQRPANVGQTAGFAKRDRFTASKDDVHRNS